MKRLLQVLLILTYPLLVFSALLPAGLVFAVAFLADFTVENRRGQSIVITPVLA